MRRLFFLAGLLGGAIPVLAHPLPLARQPASSSDPVVEDAASDPGPTGEESRPEAKVLAEVVVTASLEALERSRLPFAVDVIGAEEIERRQATEISDLLATLPGLMVVRSGSPGKVTSLFTRGTESDHTLVLWNGVELNNPFFGGYDWGFLSTEGVSRVEVARGPYSATHGGEALGGVVQILTGGGGSGGSTFRIEGGDEYFRGAVSSTAKAWDERARVDLAGHFRRGDGETRNDFYDSEEAMVHVELDLAPGYSLGILARANDSEIGIPFALGAASPMRQSAWSERQLAMPFHADLEQWRIESQVSWVGLESVFSDPDDAFAFTGSKTDSEALRFRAAATRALGTEAWLAFGAETERLEVDDRSVFGVNLEGANQETESVFAEVFYAAGKVTLDVGLRHDRNDVFGSHLSPRLGVAVALGTGARLRASFGEGFRSPSLGELFFPFSGNLALEPEESRSAELGMEIERSGWRFGATVFETRLTNLIDFDFSTFTNINIGEAQSRGAEVSANFRGKTIDLSWNATVLEAEDRLTGLALLRRPEETANLLLTFHPRESWLLQMTARFVGARDDVDPLTFGRARNPGFLEVDLAGQWSIDDRFTPYARVENVADREYDEVLGFPAPGRRLVGGLALHWR